MKRRWLLIAGLAVALFGGGLYLWQAGAVQIDFTWDYDYAVDPACTATLTTDCVEGFELSASSGVLATIPNPSNPTGFVAGITTTITKGPPYGPQTFSLVATGRDGAGNRIDSNPSTVTATIRPGKPQNIRVP
ncbi:hypothetical protein LCGC14_0935670 [marine sediment metagenome]|uniref:Uncharacterized protein n=1 Tax=marine sediment metagenome TaxID=412755 RepID=A0A0F9NLN9_9ZZZZ